MRALDDATCRLFDVGREIEDLSNDYLTRPRSAGLALCDQDAMRDLRVVRDDDAKIVDRNISRNAFLLRRPDDLNDATRRLFDVGRVVENLGNDDLAGPGPTRLALCDQDAMRDLCVVRDDDADATFADKLSRYLASAAFDYIDESALGLAAPVGANDLDRNTVAMKQGAHLPGGQVYVVGAVIRYDEAEAIIVAAYATRDEFELRSQAILVAAILDDLARADHGVQPIDKQCAHALTLQRKAGKNNLYFQRLTSFC